MVRVSGRTVIEGVAKAALVPPAAFAVHQLRYLLAFGGDAGAQLGQTGHSYLHSAVPWVVLLVGLAAGGFLWALGRAFAGRRSSSRRSVSFAVLWLACSAALVAIFATQELLEGLFATGHPAGLVGVFGYGGWWAVPAAVGVGLVLAAVFYVARWALDEIAGRRTGPRPTWRRVPLALPVPCEVWASCPQPLVEGWSGRGPPTP